jgi:hypothetical protein
MAIMEKYAEQFDITVGAALAPPGMDLRTRFAVEDWG